MVTLKLTEEEALILRDAVSEYKCHLSSDEKGIVRNISNFSGRRKEMIQSCIDIKNMIKIK